MADEQITGAGAGTGTGAAGDSGAPPTDKGATSPTQPTGAGGGDGIQQLRSAYEKVKQEYEPYQKLGLKPDQISQYSAVYQKTYEEVAAIGRQLGYPDDEILEALQENPVATLDFLRNEFAQAREGQQRQGDQELQSRVAEMIEQGIAPVQEWQNQQMTQAANALFERTAYQMAAEVYKKEGIDVANVPEEELSLLLSATSEILKYDEDALKALKYEGKTAPVQKAFQEAKTLLDKYYIARSQRSAGRPAAGAPRTGQQPQPGANGGKKPTLDDLINSPELINQKYAER